MRAVSQNFIASNASTHTKIEWRSIGDQYPAASRKASGLSWRLRSNSGPKFGASFPLNLMPAGLLENGCMPQSRPGYSCRRT